MTKLSVVTINFNNAKGLDKTIKSVVNQTYNDFEYIVIDGGSTDESKQVIEKFVDKISYWISEKDSGIYDAMNKGILVAKGEYCLFLNSGDILYHHSVLAKVFELSFAEDILYGELLFDFGLYTNKPVKRPERVDITHLFNDNIWHPSTFIKRSLFDSVGLYNNKYKIAGDYDFFFHAIAIKKVSTKYLPFPISVYDTKGISSNADIFRRINEERDQIHQAYLSDDEIENLSRITKPRPVIKHRNIFYKAAKQLLNILK